jgi:P4 family phage/plasmid primase-like protien
VRDVDYSSAVDFLESFFRGAEHAIDIRALANDADQKPVQRFTRDRQIVLDTCERYDGIGRGIFFGVATRLNGSHSGKREDLAELPGLWTDIDCYKLEITKEVALEALRSCPLPPTVIVDSGGGLHAYWLFLEPLDVRWAPQVGRLDTVKDEIDSALRQLAGVFAGDMRSCDITRVLRLPATHNTKDGTLRPVGIFEASGKRYDLSDILDMLDYLRPLIETPQPPPPLLEQDAALERNPYTEFAARYGFKAPIDVEQRLRAMSYMAAGDAGVHITQLACSASLVASGHASDDEIVSALMSATQAAAGHYGMSWNWSREEKRVYDMVRTARAKYGRPAPPRDVPRPLPDKPADLPPPGGKASGTTGEIVDLDARRRPKAPPKDDGAPVIVRLGEAAIGYWQDTHGLLISTGLGMATYDAAEGRWAHFDDEIEHRLRVAIQGVMAATGVKPQIGTLNAVYRYIVERPALHREAVAWDSSGLIVCRNGAVDPRSGALVPHSPEHYATWRIDCDYDPAAACPRFVDFLCQALDGLEPLEATRVVATLGEHMGASLVKGKVRNLSKALMAIGKSRSGKTSVASLYRALLGGAKRCAALKLDALCDMFGAAPLIKAAAWVADDAIRQGSGGRYAETINVEQLKNIITGEPMSIRVPGGRYVEASLDLPVVLTANNLPLFRDDSDAVYNRMLIFPMNHEWPEDAPNPDPLGREIAQVLIEEELGGILNFAIMGYARLKARGRYDPPPTMLAAVAELREANQPLIRWMEECIALSDHTQIDNRDIMGSLRGWWLQQFDDDRAPGGRTVNSVLKRHYPTMQAIKSHGWRISAGIELTEDGEACLRHALDTAAQLGKVVGSGCEAHQANCPR